MMSSNNNNNNVSLTGSVLQFNSPNVQRTRIGKINGGVGDDDDMAAASPDEGDEFYNRLPNLTDCKNYLNIFSSRRVSSVTCSSADSAYLERRCSAFEIGLPYSPPYLLRHSREKIVEKKKKEPLGFYSPIDIQVLLPLPPPTPIIFHTVMIKKNFFFFLGDSTDAGNVTNWK